MPGHAGLCGCRNALILAERNQCQWCREKWWENQIMIFQQRVSDPAPGLDRGKDHENMVPGRAATRTQMGSHSLRERDFPGVQDRGRWVRRHPVSSSKKSREVARIPRFCAAPNSIRLGLA